MCIKTGLLALCLAGIGLSGCQKTSRERGPRVTADELASASAVLLERKPSGRLRVSDPAVIRRLARGLGGQPAAPCGCMASHFLTFFLPDGREVKVALAAETWVLLGDGKPAPSWQDRAGRTRGEVDRLLGFAPPAGLTEALSAQLACRFTAGDLRGGGLFSGLCQSERGGSTVAFVCQTGGDSWSCRRQ
jgi:hypothetical protein